MRRRPVDECRELLVSADAARLPRIIRSLADDDREGVVRAVEVARRRLKAHRAEVRRIERMAEMQAALHAGGAVVVAGVDEVGRGCLAGPVSAGAAVLPADLRILGLDDSKRLTPERRVELAATLRESCLAWSVAHVESSVIDACGIAEATRRAMRAALEGLGVDVDHTLVDGLDGRLGVPCTPVVEGDSKVACIAAASILAKVTRDALMAGLDPSYPGYGFAEHKGYGTPEHLAALAALGPCDLHRMTFAPLGGIDQPSLF